ncbi:unnamed protein product [Peniophora sp. CBMAI 1063]|nr:unnamed protein product [Peniophora sp. CBMAI 1063]
MRYLAIVVLLARYGRGGYASSVRGRTTDTWLPNDVCAYLDVDLNVTGTHGAPDVVEHLDACLCLSEVTNFCQSDAIPLTLSSVKDKKEVENALSDLIKQHAADAKCVYPLHAKPICIGDDPCGFVCTDGFESYTPPDATSSTTPCTTSSTLPTSSSLSSTLTTSAPTPLPTAPNSTTCICPSPKIICNGICTSARSCPSQVPPVKRQKRWVGSGACTMRGDGWMACGVYGGAARAWECIDTNTDLESCGGCDLPLTPYSLRGTDCSALPGVADVSCHNGSCAVRRCLPGWTVALDRSHCVSYGADGRVVVQIPAV